MLFGKQCVNVCLEQPLADMGVVSKMDAPPPPTEMFLKNTKHKLPIIDTKNLNDFLRQLHTPRSPWRLQFVLWVLSMELLHVTLLAPGILENTINAEAFDSFSNTAHKLFLNRLTCIGNQVLWLTSPHTSGNHFGSTLCPQIICGRNGVLHC